MTKFDPTDEFYKLMNRWTDMWRESFVIAPEKLMQSINDGWSFGNVIVNNRNSKAPGTERAILAEASYGKQLGQILDAVQLLAQKEKDRSPGFEDTDEFKAVNALHSRVKEIKKQAITDRIRQINRDLDFLQTNDPVRYREILDSLEARIKATKT